MKVYVFGHRERKRASTRTVGPHDGVDLPNYGVGPYAHKLNLRYNEPARPPQARFPLARPPQAKFPPAKSPTDKVPAGKAPAGEVPAGKVPDGQSSRRQGPRRTKFPHPGRVPAATDGFKQ